MWFPLLKRAFNVKVPAFWQHSPSCASIELFIYKKSSPEMRFNEALEMYLQKAVKKPQSSLSHLPLGWDSPECTLPTARRAVINFLSIAYSLTHKSQMKAAVKEVTQTWCGSSCQMFQFYIFCIKILLNNHMGDSDENPSFLSAFWVTSEWLRKEN